MVGACWWLDYSYAFGPRLILVPAPPDRGCPARLSTLKVGYAAGLFPDHAGWFSRLDWAGRLGRP